MLLRAFCLSMPGWRHSFCCLDFGRCPDPIWVACGVAAFLLRAPVFQGTPGMYPPCPVRIMCCVLVLFYSSVPRCGHFFYFWISSGALILSECASGFWLCFCFYLGTPRRVTPFVLLGVLVIHCFHCTCVRRRCRLAAFLSTV